MRGPGEHRTAFVSDDDWCAAVLTLPAGEGPHPTVVMAHGFGMTMACRLAAFAAGFAAAGIASLRFDYRGFGESGGDERQVLDVDRQRDDYRAALAHVRGLPEVDATRLVLWGTSFSGGHVLVVAADEPDLAAVVAQVPFTDGPATLRGAPQDVAPEARNRAAPEARGEVAPHDDGDRAAWARHLATLTARATADAAGARLGRPPLLVPVGGPLGSGALISGPDAEQELRTLVPDGVPWRNEVAARVALRLPREVPADHAPRIVAPLLVVTCEVDRVTPPGPAQRAAAAAPDGHVVTFPLRHFEAYVPPGREQLLAAEVAWLRPRLGLA